MKHKILFFFTLMQCFSVVSADERLGFEAEHLLESAMNARYLALPLIPRGLNKNEARVQTGLLRYTASRIDSKGIMLGAQYYMAANPNSGFMFSAFSDYLKFNENPGLSTFEPAFIKNLPFTTPLKINISSVNGSAIHLGFSAAMVQRLSPTISWQYGAVVEYFDVKQFDVLFTTVEETTNFSGLIDYSEIYTALTPYFTVRKYFQMPDSSLRYSTRLVGAWPLPRQGFSGRVAVANFDQSSSTNDVGNGTHIPDPFVGLGLNISNASETWSLDIGAAFYFHFVEGLIHEGIDAPLLVSFTWKL